MKEFIIYFFALVLASNIYAGNKSRTSKQPVDYVDPFICTQGDHGQWLPAANVPFGLIELCPDTYPGSLTANVNIAHSGYDYSDSQIRGFSHFHRGSSGNRPPNRAGLLSIIPFAKIPSDTFFINPILNIDRKSEIAKAGYYSVRLTQDNILAQLTATAHTGSHRYTFPPGVSAKLFLYEGNRDASKNLTCKLIDKYTAEGIQEIYNGIYFCIKFNMPVKATKIWNGERLLNGDELDKVNKGGFVFEFGDLKGKPLEVVVGVSLTSIKAARNNLKIENPDFNFNRIKNKAYILWNDVLSKIKVQGTEEYKTIFYNALYHTCFLPVTITDDDGTYPGLDEKLHKAKGYVHYDDYSFWDSFRTKYSLYSLYLPDIYRDIAKSLRDIYEQGDWDKPDGTHKPHGTGSDFEMCGKNGFEVYDNCRNEHMLMIMTDAYFKGLFDNIKIEKIYPYLRREAMVQMGKKYDKIGYIPARPDQTGEYSWDSWCVARVAKEIGNEKDYNYFMKRSNYWKNTWDSTKKFFRARAADGKWLDFPEDPTINDEKYTYEGTLWQYRWNVLHDVRGLIDALGGDKNFVGALNYFFENNLYTAGDEPDIHAPYLFNFAGAAWLTQKWTHKILTQPMIQLYGTHRKYKEPIDDRIYKTTPDGYLLEMDDDYGCMAAWYALSAMGLYQVCPGNPVYQLSSPIFKKTVIELDNKIYPAKKFTIIAKNLSNKNYYIQSATLNGKQLNRCWITHDEIIKGGDLIYVMGPTPNRQWGK